MAFPPHASTVLYLHQEVIQLTTRPPDLSSADLFSGMKSNGFWTVIIPSKRYYQENPSMPASFILVPATWITQRMQPVTISNNYSLRTNIFESYNAPCKSISQTPGYMSIWRAPCCLTCVPRIDLRLSQLDLFPPSICRPRFPLCWPFYRVMSQPFIFPQTQTKTLNTCIHH